MAATQDSTQDTSSVYYIHPSDSSLQSFVTDKFDGEGFSSWKRSMLIGFSTKNKMGFIDGTLPKPLPTDPRYNAWVRCNDMVIGWILKALGPIPAKSVFFFKTTSAMWKDLVTRYGQTTSTQLYSLQEEIASLHQGNDSIPEFFAKIKVLWDELDDLYPMPSCECGGNCTCNLGAKFLKIQEDNRLMQFLMKLKDEFKQVRSSILMIKPLPSIAEVYSMLLQEEKHKELLDQQVHTQFDAVVLAADRRQSFDNRSFRPAKFRGSNVNDRSGFEGRKPYVKRNAHLVCDHCKMQGHIKDKCYKLHGYPIDSRGYGSDSRGYGQKRYANCVPTDEVGQDSGVDSEFVQASFTKDQYSQIMKMLDKQSSVEAGQGSGISDPNASSTCFVGAFLDKGNCSW